MRGHSWSSGARPKAGLVAEHARPEEQLDKTDSALVDASLLTRECQAELERIHKEALAAGPPTLDDLVRMIRLLARPMPQAMPSTCDLW